MRNSLETRIGIFVALVVLAAVFILDIVGGAGKFTRGYRLHALFNNVQELKVGDRVKMAGVDVGWVEKVQLRDNKVDVILKLRSNADVKTDSTATVKFTGLMGQNYVAIDFGSPSAPRLEDNQVVTTKEQPDLSAMLAKLDTVATGVENLTKSFTGDKIDNLLGPFTDFLKANQAPLTGTISNLNSISSQIAEGKGTVGKLIYDQALYNSALTTILRLQATGEEVKLAVSDARSLLAQVNAGQGTAGKLIKDETLYNESTASMANMRQILEKINHGQGSVGKLVNDQEFYKNAKLSLQKLDKATDGLEDQGALSVLGIAVQHLF
ncbi:MAG TPA: MlaD family protein [Verrucomicrobiae bacterium]|nr:MlaD family protein [Verrucomicrobiae bacterium]